MSGAARVMLFANQEERLNWEWNNCDRCSKRETCDLNEAIASASWLDGTVSAQVADRLGFKPDWDGRSAWWCPEQETSK